MQDERCAKERSRAGLPCRVNRGSKYFSDEEKASAYFDYMTACGFEAELWLVRRYYDEQGTLVKGEQVLWESESDDGIISLLN